MTLYEYIHAHQWLSVELVMAELFPDLTEQLEDYKEVYGQLLLMEPVAHDFEIEFIEQNDTDPLTGRPTSCIRVSGRKIDAPPDEREERYALEFLEWRKWLGMQVAEASRTAFSELEIIAHCLHEMTFISFEEADIQNRFKELMESVEAFERLTPEQREQELISLEELLKRLDKNKDDEIN